MDQLPDIKEEHLTLVWDHSQANEILIRNGPDVIFRQPGSWEYYDYFIAACRVLKTKYGYHLMDVVPTLAAQCAMDGDSLTASNKTDEMRRLIGIDCRQGVQHPEKEKWKTYNQQYD